MYSETIKKTYRKYKNSFIRNRKLTFTKLLLFMMNMSRRSLQVELNDFIDIMEAEESYSISKQAFSKARKNLCHKVFIKLDEVFVDIFYKDNKECQRWKKFRLIGIDGSTIQLPNTLELRDEFGVSKNKSTTKAMARISSAYDLLNDLTLDAKITRSSHSKETKKMGKRIDERGMALEHLKRIKEKDSSQADHYHHENDLFLFDMGYPSYELIYAILAENKHFVMRCEPTRFTKEVAAAYANSKKDQLILLNGPDNSQTTIRVIKIKLENGIVELLLTSLLEKKDYPRKLFGPLYQKRWGSETNYYTLKRIMQIENFSGKTVESVYQDFYAAIFMNNIRGVIQGEVLEELKEESKNTNQQLKHGFKINTSLCVASLKNKIIQIVVEQDDITQIYSLLKNKIKKYTVPIRPGRSFARKGIHRGRGTKYPFAAKRVL